MLRHLQEIAQLSQSYHRMLCGLGSEESCPATPEKPDESESFESILKSFTAES